MKERVPDHISGNELPKLSGGLLREDVSGARGRAGGRGGLVGGRDAGLGGEVLPYWKHRLARDITRRDVRERIEAIAKRGPIFANRVRAMIHKLFNFAIQHDIVEHNPVAGTARPGIERKRDRVLKEDEIRQPSDPTSRW